MKKKDIFVNVKNYKVKPAFKDARGEIFDLIEDTVRHIGLITFKKGAIRGRHYHKRSMQYSYIIKGKLRLTVSDITGNHKKNFTLSEGTISAIPPHIVHTYTALTDATMLDLTTLSRLDRGYEDDTIRVQETSLKKR